MVTFGYKWEVLVLVSNCCVRLGTAWYREVWRTVWRYRDTNRSDTVCCVCGQGREVDTAVTGCSRLNVTGKAWRTEKCISSARRTLGSDSYSSPVENIKCPLKKKCKNVLMIKLQHFLEVKKFIRRSKTKHNSTQINLVKNRVWLS